MVFGDNSTTFNVPNLTDRVIQGNGTPGTYKNAGLPNISGRFGNCEQAYAEINGAFTYILTENGGAAPHTTENPGKGYNIDFDASRSNSIYGNSATVQPPALTMLFCIKY